MSVVVAIDGPVAAGKGTLARRIASHFGFAYLDTGSLYRAVGSKVLREGADPADQEAAARAAASLTPADLSAPDLRTEQVGNAASVVASQPRVRAALLAYQRGYAASPPGGAKGAVLDGRDIGTVVCPEAPIKLFIIASAEIRAHRRWLELKGKGETVPEAQVLEDLRARDERDMNRADAPLKPAPDAHLLDTSNLDIEAAFRAASDFVAARM